MKKKINGEAESSLIYLILKEKYLLIFILTISISLTLILNYKQSSKLKEINTRVFIELPTNGHELFLITNDLLGPNVNNYANDGFKYYRNKFFYDLISIDSLINFLNKEKNSKYLETFNKYNLDPRLYLARRVKTETDSKFDSNFVITFLITHPVNFDISNFLKDYINDISYITKSNFIDAKLEISNNILEILKKKYEIKKKIENNSKNNNQIEKDIKILNLVDINNDNLNNVFSPFFSDISLDRISMQIELVSNIADKISKITFEPNFRFESEIYSKKKSILRDLVLSILISFVIFFSILTFKQFFKKFLV